MDNTTNHPSGMNIYQYSVWRHGFENGVLGVPPDVFADFIELNQRLQHARAELRETEESIQSLKQELNNSRTERDKLCEEIKQTERTIDYKKGRIQRYRDQLLENRFRKVTDQG